MRKNVASQVVAFQAISTTDGSAVTSGTPTVYYTIDGGTQGTGTATPVHEGNGQWSWVPTQAETNGNHLAYTFVLTGCISQCINVYTVSFDPHDTVRLGITALPNAAADAAGGLVISDAGGLAIDTVASNVAAILVDTGTDIPNSLVTIDTVVDAILVDTGTDIPTLINTVDTVVDQILADTGTDGVVVAAGSKTGYTLTATTGLGNQTANITGTITTATNVTTVNGLAANVITAASIATDAIDADALAADAIAEINATVDTALADIHLDHLLATDYDPASKPGVATALLNELIESNAGVSRYTAAALAQAPSGTGASASAIADAVWTELIADHSGVSGSTAEALAAAGGAGDPWITSLPGSYTGTQAGKILADILTDTGTTLDGKIDTIDGIVDSILVDTAELQTDWVNGGRLDLILDSIKVDTTGTEATVTGIASNVTIILGELPPNFVDMAISAGTGYVISSSVQGNVTGSVGSVATVFNIADQVWDEVLSGHLTAGTTGEALSNAGGGSSPSAIADAVWDEARTGHVTAGTFGYYLDAQISGVSGSGAGLYTITVAVANSDGDALQGARVNIDGTDQTLTTPTNGIVTFNLDAGTYSLVVSPPAGYQTPSNTSITVSADASTTITLTAGSSGVGWLG